MDVAWFCHLYLATNPTFLKYFGRLKTKTSKFRRFGRRYWLLVTGLPINDVSKQNGRWVVSTCGWCLGA
jgi:hypothetical protein